MLTDYHLHLRPDELDATRRPSTSPTRTSSATSRRPREAGIEELGVSEHIHRFTEALEIWDHPFWRENARDDLAAYCEFVRSTPLRLGIEMDFVAGREDRIANVLDAPRLRLRRRLGPLRRRPGGRLTTSTTSGSRSATPTGSGSCYFETLAEAVAHRPLRHPRPPRPGQGLGRRPARSPSATRASTTSRRSRRSPRPGSRSRSRPRAGASRSTSSIPSRRLRRDVRRRRRRVRALLRRPRARGRRPSTTSARWRRCAAGASSEIAVFEGRERRLEPLG